VPKAVNPSSRFDRTPTCNIHTDRQRAIADTIRYDTRCYFNVCALKLTQVSLIYRTEPQLKVENEELKSKQHICSEVSVTVREESVESLESSLWRKMRQFAPRNSSRCVRRPNLHLGRLERVVTCYLLLEDDGLW